MKNSYSWPIPPHIFSTITFLAPYTHFSVSDLPKSIMISSKVNIQSFFLPPYFFNFWELYLGLWMLTQIFFSYSVHAGSSLSIVTNFSVFTFVFYFLLFLTLSLIHILCFVFYKSFPPSISWPFIVHSHLKSRH
jgi:hypothetical protein